MRGSIIKRGKHSWAVVIYLGRDPETGKARQKWSSYSTRQEAEDQLPHLVTQARNGELPRTTRLRVGDYLERWLRDYVEMAVRPTTAKSYRETVRRHMIPAFGALPLQQLGAVHVQEYVTKKLREERVYDRGRRGKVVLPPLSSTSVRYHVTVLHAALKQAVEWGLLGRNPVDRVKRPRRDRPEMRVWDEEQTRLFLGEAKRTSPHYRLYLAAVTTGARQGELLGLSRRSLDLTLGVAHIRHTLNRLGRDLLMQEPKTSRGRRQIALPAVLVQELRVLLAEQDRLREKLGECPEGTACKTHDCVAGWHDFGFVFCQPNGKPLHAHNLTRGDFRRVIERAKVPAIRFHDLRHCHATHLGKMGVPLKVIQERLGHANPAFTLAVYSHVLPGMQADAARAIEARLFSVAEPEISTD